MGITESIQFKQKDYRLRLGLDDLGGLCITLVAKWCYLMLSDKMDVWSNPQSSAKARFAKFEAKEVYTTIAQEQRVSNARLARFSTARNNLETMILVARVMGSNGFIDERQPLIDAVVDTGRETHARGDRIPRDILSRFGCSNVSAPVVVEWTSIAASLSEKCCYAIVFVTVNRRGTVGQHAIGIYISGGLFNHDYHLFDPNDGEFKADDTSSIKKLLGVIQSRYGNPSHARIFKMAL